MSLSLLRLRTLSRPYSAWILVIFALTVALSGFGHNCTPEAAAAHQPVGIAVVDLGHGEHAAPDHACPACTWQAEAGNGLWPQVALRISAPALAPPVKAGVAPLRRLRNALQPQRGPPSV